ncbi:protein NEDD1 isoform X1 [Hydra vulgaris]|uniref:protein NEDD1 isoform X1 n=1 Tax=Hydra vulgaris TaxID=6087 RepID=UPI001F5FF032|nr:protein NEDD1 [Hydra vulgaris]
MPELLLATAGEDLRLWAMPTLNLHSVKNGTNANLTSCSCSPNGQLVAYAHEGEGLNVASLQEDDQDVINIPTSCEQSSVSFNGNSRYLVSSGVDHVVCIWDIKSKTAKRIYKDHTHPVTCSIFNYNDNTIASSSNHGNILLTNVQSGVSSEPLSTGENQAIRSLNYSHFVRSLLASINDSGAVSLWDTKEKKLIKTFTEHKGPGTKVSFSPLNDMLLCSCGLDKRIIFYDVTGKKMVKTINTEGPVTCCEFMHDGCTVAAGTASGRLYLFDLRQGSTPVKVVTAHKTSVRSVSFQMIPKEKSPNRIAADNNSLGRVEGMSQKENSLEVTNNTQQPSDGSTSQINNTPTYTTMNNIQNNASSLNQRENTSNSMVQRENSTVNLNNMLNLNKVANLKVPQGNTAATPMKAAKLNSDDIFSPIPIDVNIRKAAVSRQKSTPKVNSFLAETNVTSSEEMRPTYLRSKSSFSKFSSVARSTDDLSYIQKKGREKDGDKDSIDSGKRGILGFKSPFKKKHVKHSDESETSSIESFDQNGKSPMAGRRDKNEQKSDRSIDSFTSLKISNASEQLYNVTKIDTNQFASDIQHSLAMQITSPNHPAEVNDYHSSFQIELIKSMIDDAMEESRTAVHDAIVNLQVEMLRQMEIQKEQIRQMILNHSVNEDLVSEVNRLRAENERLRLKY